MTLQRERRPRAEAPSRTASNHAAKPTSESTVRPLPSTLLGGAKLIHDLARNGYRIATTCRGCGAPLIDPRSVARQLGPVCSKRMSGDG